MKRISYLFISITLLLAVCSCKDDTDKLLSDPIEVEIDLSEFGSGELALTSKDQTGTFRWDGTTLYPNTPFTWNDLDGETHDFSILFTPDAEGTPEKDIHEGTIRNVLHGEKIKLGKLKRSNVLLEIRIMIVCLSSNLSSKSEMDSPQYILHGLSDLDYVIYGRQAIVKPVTLTDEHRITAIELESKTALIKDLIYPPGTVSLLAGETYDITFVIGP
ncbi:hypothetical protein [Parabacteroides sp. PF5-9]|uniref:hypothetical protein n=1 Tax=Parabacteroides sp. PF5-9 TaxID=1742404 RepID=UPI00247470C2|nr:hypothetical protein [Parabacteroides sp. PF5-9]MDH6359168.1 hypothetical protein [Parabacteroides sp. PF5-9]